MCVNIKNNSAVHRKHCKPTILHLNKVKLNYKFSYSLLQVTSETQFPYVADEESHRLQEALLDKAGQRRPCRGTALTTLRHPSERHKHLTQRTSRGGRAGDQSWPNGRSSELVNSSSNSTSSLENNVLQLWAQVVSSIRQRGDDQFLLGRQLYSAQFHFTFRFLSFPSVQCILQ